MRGRSKHGTDGQSVRSVPQSRTTRAQRFDRIAQQPHVRERTTPPKLFLIEESSDGAFSLGREAWSAWFGRRVRPEGLDIARFGRIIGGASIVDHWHIGWRYAE